MTKHLIIIERCKDCENSAIGFITKTRHCGLSIEHIEDDCPEDGTPDWCPLPALPEPRAIYTLDKDGRNDVLAMGWNACLEEIERGDNDE